jgi:hypothetical protein
MKKVWIYSRIANAENFNDAYRIGQEKSLKELVEQHCFNISRIFKRYWQWLNLNRNGLKKLRMPYVKRLMLLL